MANQLLYNIMDCDGRGSDGGGADGGYSAESDYADFAEEDSEMQPPICLNQSTSKSPSPPNNIKIDFEVVQNDNPNELPWTDHRREREHRHGETRSLFLYFNSSRDNQSTGSLTPITSVTIDAPIEPRRRREPLLGVPEVPLCRRSEGHRLQRIHADQISASTCTCGKI